MIKKNFTLSVFAPILSADGRAIGRLNYLVVIPQNVFIRVRFEWLDRKSVV